MAIDYDQIRLENIREYGEGTRHLAFFDRLYSDRTHFLFELFQNAEDARATQMHIVVDTHAIDIFHNGRCFTERDVRGICGLGDGTKGDDYTKIGKFGIGFKAVYAYTKMPLIRSGDAHFAIASYVRPEAIAPVEIPAPYTTWFRLPFDNPTILASDAADEIIARLHAFDARMLLFLQSLETITWKSFSGVFGSFHRSLRDGTKALKQLQLTTVRDEKTSKEKWFVADRVIKTPTHQYTSVALGFRYHLNDRHEPIIRPIDHVPLTVYFPTAKIIPMGFLVHGPYRTTPARDNIPERDPWNQYLVQETVALLVETLDRLRDAQWLTWLVLESLPLQETLFPESSLLRPFYTAILEAFKTHHWIPSDDATYLTPEHARIPATQRVRTLFPSLQLARVLNTTHRVQWVEPSLSKDRFPKLWVYLRTKIGLAEISMMQVLKTIEEPFLAKQSDAWLMDLYRWFASLRHDLWRGDATDDDTAHDSGFGDWQLRFHGHGRSRIRTPHDVLEHKPLIRCNDGKHRRLNRESIFLPTSSKSHFTTIKYALIQDKDILRFFQDQGIRSPDLVDEVTQFILPKYDGDTITVTDEEHLSDITLIAKAIRTVMPYHPLLARLKTTYFVLASNPETQDSFYCQPGNAYTSLDQFDPLIEGNPDIYYLDPRYTADHQQAFVTVGMPKTLIHYNPNAIQQKIVFVSNHGHHQRSIPPFDPTFRVDGLEWAMNHIDHQRACFIWNELVIPYHHHIRGEIEQSTRQDFRDPHRKTALSPMGKLVVERAWIPTPDGRFIAPHEIAVDDLPDGFEHHQAAALAVGMMNPVLQSLAQQMNLPPELIKDLKENPERYLELFEQRRQRSSRGQKPARSDDAPPRSYQYRDFRNDVVNRFQRGQQGLPTRVAPPASIDDPDEFRDSQRADVQHAQTQEPDPYQRQRVTIRREWEATDPTVRMFLHNQYAGVCQICQTTFRKRDGEPYFEAHFIVSVTHARWIVRPGNVLCLCATCGAKWQYGSVETDDIIADLLAIEPSSLPPDSCPSISMMFCDEPVQLTFRLAHILDLQAMLTSDEQA